jgi:ArsR family transcriptional regulator, arsenate/arsenite/antimonite-responsive transcriptional repressor
MKTTQALEALSALAHATRLEVFRRLVRAGPPGLVAGELAAALEIPAPTLSFHLAHLERAGLVAALREGRSIRYSADFTRMRALIDYLLEDCCRGAASGGTTKGNRTR